MAEPLWLSFKLAAVTSLLLLVIGIPIAWWLSESKSRWKPAFESLVSLPLVLPPTVLGFYLLLVFSPAHGIGGWLQEWVGVSFVFSFEGLVLASIIYSLPFMVQPVQAGLANLPRELSEASYVLGKSKWQTLIRVLLPNCKPALLTGLVLSFAHTLGEFGVVLMIGGNLPGETRVASIAIYDQVEALNYEAAHGYSLALLLITFVILFITYAINHRWRRREQHD
ncbi:molybdate ABC transporter permease subunit [bacterium SCSIO 12741]|nr:molybdate ABC transporter permease subunit [bacterium SCSIO 12741]